MMYEDNTQKATIPQRTAPSGAKENPPQSSEPRALLTAPEREAHFREISDRLDGSTWTATGLRGQTVPVSYRLARAWCEDRGTNVRAGEALWAVHGAPAGVYALVDEDGKRKKLTYGNADRQTVRFNRARKTWLCWAGEDGGAHWERDTSGVALRLFDPIREVLDHFADLGAWASEEVSKSEAVTMKALQENVGGAQDDRARDEAEREVESALRDFKRARDRFNAMARPFKKMLEKCSATYFQRESLEQACAGENSLGDSGEHWDDFDAVRNVVPVGNGILTIGREGTEVWNPCTGKSEAIGESGVHIRPGHPSDRFLMRTDVEYHPNAGGTAWRQFVLSLFGYNEEIATWFQEVVGSALLRNGDVAPQAYFLFGAGSNGKTTLFHILHAALGGLYLDANPALLLDRNLIDSPNGPTPALDELPGRAILAVEEMKANAVLDPAQLKRLCPGTDLSTRAPYSSITVHYRTTAVPFIGTNTLPQLREFDHGITRRLKAIPCTQQFVPRGKARVLGLTGGEKTPGPGQQWADEGIERKLTSRAELEGVLFWAIEGAVRVAIRGRVSEPPQIVVDATTDWVEGENGLAMFCHECLESHAGTREAGKYRESFKAVYKAYGEWCDRSGIEHPLSKVSFSKKLYALTDPVLGTKKFAQDRSKDGERVVLYAKLVGESIL